MNIYYKIRTIEKFFKSNNDLKIDTIYKGFPIGEWAIQIKRGIKDGTIKIELIQNPIFLEYVTNNAERIPDRADRMVHFLSKYIDLWYKSEKDINQKIQEITDDEEEQQLILSLYEQAEEDYTILRSVRTRYYERMNGKRTTNAYNMDEALIERLREANIGRAFGLSTENKSEYDRLINECGINPDVVDYVYKHFSSYKKFKEAYIEAIRQGRGSNFLPYSIARKAVLVKDIDISGINTVKNSERGYVELFKIILGREFIIFNGAKLISSIEKLIEYDEGKKAEKLTEKEKMTIRYLYGLGYKKLSYEEIARLLNVSRARTDQMQKSALKKLSRRKKQLEDLLYIDDEKMVDFFAEYFSKHDIFITDEEPKRHEFLDEDMRQEFIIGAAYNKVCAEINKFYSENLADGEFFQKYIKVHRLYEDISDCIDEDSVKVLFIQNTAKELIEKIKLNIEKISYLSEKEKEIVYDRVLKSKEYAYIQLAKEPESLDEANMYIDRSSASEYGKHTKSILDNAKGIDDELRAELLKFLDMKMDIINEQNKKERQKLMDRIQSTRIEEFYVSNVHILNCNLSARSYNCLGTKRLMTIGSIIQFSNTCTKSIKNSIRNMGNTAFEEIKSLMSMYGLTLEDENKSPEIHERNLEVLNNISSEDTTRLLFFFKQMSYDDQRVYLTTFTQSELDDYREEIMDHLGLDRENADEYRYIQNQIRLMNCKFGRNTEIDILNVPEDVLRLLKEHKIEKIFDLYRMNKEGMEYIFYYYPEYRYFIQAELKRIGLTFSTSGEALLNKVGKNVYANRYNIEMIKYFIETSNLSVEEKKELYVQLLEQLNNLNKGNQADLDVILLNKIEELEGLYKLLNNKENTIASMEQNNSKNKNLEDIE